MKKERIGIIVYFLFVFTVSMFVLPIEAIYSIPIAIVVSMFFTLGLMGSLNEPPSEDDGGFHPHA